MSTFEKDELEGEIAVWRAGSVMFVIIGEVNVKYDSWVTFIRFACCINYEFH